MVFKKYDVTTNIPYITESWYSGGGAGILSLLFEERFGTLHIVYGGNKGGLFVHVSANGIKADGYRAIFNEKGVFAGKVNTDISALRDFEGEIETSDLPDNIVELYKRALEFDGEIRP